MFQAYYAFVSYFKISTNLETIRSPYRVLYKVSYFNINTLEILFPPQTLEFVEKNDFKKPVFCLTENRLQSEKYVYLYLFVFCLTTFSGHAVA
jgi:hypothetical protein